MQSITENEWDNKFIFNVHTQINNGRALTTKQAASALRIALKIKDTMIRHNWVTEHNLLDLINNPKYRLPLRITRDIPAEVRYLGDNKLGFRAKYIDQTAINAIDAVKANSFEYDAIHRLWVLSLHPQNVKSAISLIGQYGFQYDDAVAGALSSIMDTGSDTFVIDDGCILAILNDPLLCEIVKHVFGGRPHESF